MVITLDNVSFKHIDKYQLKNVNFSFTENDMIGVVGVNGCGKSTMLKLICEELKPNSGQIIKSGNMILSYLKQEPVFPMNKTILDCMKSLETKEHPINEYEMKTVLNKLKLFNHDMLTNNLSGGEKKRLALATVLVKYSDILILDEPTNHLDNDMIVWLEKYLIKRNKGLLMVTHDRYFLQRVCNKMIELDNGNLYQYNANYDQFLELKAQRLLNEEHQKKKLNQILRHELEWVRRGAQARSTKSKSRLERFEQMSKIKFNEQKTFEFNSVKTYLGKTILEIKNGSKGFDKVLFDNFNLLLLRTDRIGIVGDNGCGKSTLFKIIMGIEKLDYGELILGETLKVGYLSQELDLVDGELRVIDYINKEAEVIETIDGLMDSKTLLESFLFDSNLQYTKIKMLSGGEKRRLQIVKVLMKNPNLLILDEPTNDLDIYTLEILENYLDSFFGPVLVVSHDRYFLDKVVDKILYYENSEIKEYMGSFSEYLEIENKEIKEAKKDTRVRIKPNMTTKEKNELYELEKDIPLLEEEIKNIEAQYVNYQTNYPELMKLINKKEELDNLLSEKMERYFILEEKKNSI